jgi:phenol 2-monooxygenase (NADPH)
MARSLPPTTWKNGWAETINGTPSYADKDYFTTADGQQSHYQSPPEAEKPTATASNKFGLSHLRSWPTLYNGTASPAGKPSWWKPSSEVDVLICGGKDGHSNLRI